MRRCKTPNCLNDAEEKRTVCRKCRGRKYRQENPLVDSYTNLKYHAKERGIDFGLTKKEWETFCEDTGYLELRGPGAMDMTIDRKDCTIGYIYSNLQMMTRYENSIKSKEEMRKRKGWSVSMEKEIGDPF